MADLRFTVLNSMKTIILAFVSLTFVFSVRAQTTYTVGSTTSWNGVFPGYCNTCTFNIAAGVTITLNTNATCYNCTINGGTLNMTSDFTFQQSAFNNTTINLNGHTLNMQNNGTSFTSSVINANSKSLFLPTGSISITGSTFNFSDTAQFNNNGGTLNISSSNLYFLGNSYLNATAGPVNLSAASQLIAGDGTTSSKAYLLFNGPALNLADASSALYVKNINNYYANWNAYNSLSNSKTYSTTGLNINCGGAGQNSCSAQLYYGCGSFSKSGPVACTPLANTISNLKGYLQGNEIRISWNATDISDKDYFQIERSINGGSFSSLNTQEGSNLNSSFSFVDVSPETGANEYRIALINADGNISYSHIIAVQNEPSSQSAISVYPNPITNGHFFVQVPTVEPVQLTVYNLQGQVIYTHSMNGQWKYTIQLPSNIGRQMLAVRLVSGSETTTITVPYLP